MSEGSGQELPQGWVRAELAAVASINPPQDRCIINDDVAVDFVPMRAVEPEGGGLLRPEASTYGAVKKGFTAFMPGDVIMAKITPCMENGKTCVVPEMPGAACFGSTEFHVVRPEKDIDARWIANFLLRHSTRHTAKRQMMGGVGQMRVPTAFLESLQVPIPPSAEQQRILESTDELLSDLDAGVAALERVQAKLKHYRAAVLKAAVEGALTAEWRAQHRATEPACALLTRILAERRHRWEEAQLQKFKEAGKSPPKDWKAKYEEPVAPITEGLPALPTGWCWASLDQAFRVERGRFSIRPRNDPRYYGGDEPFVQIGDLPREGGAIRSYHQTLNSAGLSVSKKFLSGTVLIAIVGATIGNTGILGFDSCCPDSLVALQSSSTTLLKFAEGFLRGKKLLLRVSASASGGQPNINLNLLQPMAIPLPPEDEIEAIVEAVEDQLSVIEHLEADLEAKLKSAQALRQSILRHAFTGQLVPQDPRDEPAAELLKRIAAQREERARQAQAAKKTKPKASPKSASKPTRKKLTHD